MVLADQLRKLDKRFLCFWYYNIERTRFAVLADSRRVTPGFKAFNIVFSAAPGPDWHPRAANHDDHFVELCGPQLAVPADLQCADNRVYAPRREIDHRA